MSGSAMGYLATIARIRSWEARRGTMTRKYDQQVIEDITTHTHVDESESMAFALQKQGLPQLIGTSIVHAVLVLFPYGER